MPPLLDPPLLDARTLIEERSLREVVVTAAAWRVLRRIVESNNPVSEGQVACILAPKLPRAETQNLPDHAEKFVALGQRAEGLIEAFVREAAAVRESAGKNPLLSPGGGVLPALAEKPQWVRALARARAVLVELETLKLLRSVEFRGDPDVREKWQVTKRGLTYHARRIMRRKR